MAPERGLPSVPRGLSRDLTLFLQAILRVLSSLSGLGPGSEKTRAVRVSEERPYGAGTAALTPGAVNTQHIKDGAVTSAKLADGCVTVAKLADDVLPVSIEGSAADGETVLIGCWHGEPHVSLLGFSVPLAEGATLHVGIENLREEDGVWAFDAVAHSSDGDEEIEPQTAHTGQISWRASGMRRAADEPTE